MDLMKKFKTRQAQLVSDTTTESTHLTPLLQSRELLKAVFVHYLPLSMLGIYGALTLMMGVLSELSPMSIALCVYLSVGVTSLLFMLQKHLSFRRHQNELQHVHYAFVGQQRYLWLMLSFVALVATSMGINAIILTLLLLSLVINFGRRRHGFIGGLVLAGVCGYPFALSSGNLISTPGAVWLGILCVTLAMAIKKPALLRLDV